MDNDRQHAKEVFNSMTIWQKIVYLVQNYWVTALVVVIVSALVLSFIGNFTWNRPADSYLGFGFHASIMDVDKADGFKGILTEKYGDMITDDSEFYSYWFYSGYSQDQVEQVQATTYQFTGMVAAGQIDIMIGDVATMEKDAKQLYIQSLTEIFTEEELSKIEARTMELSEDGSSGLIRLSFDISGDTGRTVKKVRDEAFLIRINGLDPDIDEIMMGQDVYLAVVGKEDTAENVRAFIYRLLDMK